MPNLYNPFICFISHKLFILLFILSSYSIRLWAQPPIIESFSPLKGNIGTLVVIKGKNFNSNPEQNIVYFGPVKAAVKSASATEVTVIAPAGASCYPITTLNTATGLMAFSSLPFQITFGGGDNFLDASSFDQEQLIQARFPINFEIGDLDADGKPDIVTVGDGGGSGFYLSVIRNTSTKGRISFATSIDSSFAGYAGRSLAIADINGDGLLDLLFGCIDNLFIHKNKSTPGNIRFEPALLVESSHVTSNASMEITDYDKDGKPDIAYLNGGMLTVLRNTSMVNNISFASPVKMGPVPSYTLDYTRIRAGDLDNDNKTDLLLLGNHADSIYVLNNISTPGNIAFEQGFRFSTESTSRAFDLTLGDIDGDGKLDITYTRMESITFTIMKNNSTPGKFKFENSGGYGPLYYSGLIVNGDVNGDGKVDLALSRGFDGDIGVLLNQSIPCSISLHSYKEYRNGSFIDLMLTDIDGDGKPDILTGNNNAGAVGVRKNNIQQKYTVCTGSSFTIPSSIYSNTYYQWQQGSGNNYTNISNDNQYSGTDSPALTLKSIPSSLDGSTFRCIAGNDTSNIFSVSISPSISSSISISFCPRPICSNNTKTILYAATANGGSFPIFQWQESSNGVTWKNIQGANTDTLSFLPVVDATKIRCLLKSSLSCVVADTVYSNTVTLWITPAKTSSCTISGISSVNSYQPATINSVSVNGGVNPLYQWQDSTDITGWKNISGENNTTISYIASKTGDKIRCKMSSSDPCSANETVFSNVIIFTVNLTTGVFSTTESRSPILIFPNPVHSVLFIDSIKLSDQWQTIQILNVNGQRKITASIEGITQKKINVSDLPQGMYYVLLSGKNKKNFYSKFIKINQ